MVQSSKIRPMTRIQAIVDRLTASIEAGIPKPGERMASVRRAAEDHGVSKNTMSEAYDQLVASGHLEARRGAGYFVRAVVRPRNPGPGAHVAEALDLVSLLREQLDQHYEVRPGDGRPPPSWMEGSELGAQFRTIKLSHDGGLEFGYGSSWGFLPLRERISLSLAERSIQCRPEQILLTHGANHALDLITRYLIEPGHVVFVDDPGYYPLFGKLRLAKAQIIGIRRNADGPDLEDLNSKLATVTPRAFFTQSLAHNPTGGSISLHVAHSLLQAAERHGFYLVEDDTFADILPSVSPRLAALDQLRRVLYVGTFSKTLSASLRVGYLAADPALAQALSDIKLLTTVATSDHVERFVFSLIAGGHYLRHLRRLRRRVEEATATALHDLSKVGLRVPQGHGGGFYLWAELPADIDEAILCREAATKSIFLAPGSVFHPGKEIQPPAMRINVAHASNPRFLMFIKNVLSR
jgi:DNA-binding transcriptional MocR family regulator